MTICEFLSYLNRGPTKLLTCQHRHIDKLWKVSPQLPQNFWKRARLLSDDFNNDE